MTAARKALEALEAAGSVERVEFSVVADSLADSWYARGPAHDVEGCDDVSAYEAASADANRFSAAVNLSAPLASVARAVADRPWMERDLNGVAYRCFLCGRDQEIVGVGHFDGCGAKEADAALDAFNAAALAQGFQP